MRLTTKNIMKLGIRPVKQTESKKTLYYNLTVNGETLPFEKYSQALDGYLLAKRNKFDAEITPVRF